MPPRKTAVKAKKVGIPHWMPEMIKCVEPDVKHHIVFLFQELRGDIEILQAYIRKTYNDTRDIRYFWKCLKT